MYGLPQDFDGKFFIGLRLDAVSFAEYVLSLSFDGGIWITVDSSYEYQSPVPGTPAERQSMPVRNSSLMQLVGRNVESCEGDENGTLTLRFEGGHVFRCFDDDSHYECYHVFDGKYEFHV